MKLVLCLNILITASQLGISQPLSPSNEAYRHFLAVRSTAEGLSAAEQWLQIYQQQTPDSKNVPPFLDVARYYLERGQHVDEVPALLEKAVSEIETPGGWTDVRTHTNSPFHDQLARSLAANAYTRIGMYSKAHDLLNAVDVTLTTTKLDASDLANTRIYAQLLFFYRDAAVRLAVAEGRKEEGLALEHDILTDPSKITSPQLIDEHRNIALGLWTALGRSPQTFESWLETGH